mgnify:CR=1 FL=1
MLADIIVFCIFFGYIAAALLYLALKPEDSSNDKT